MSLKWGSGNTYTITIIRELGWN